MENSRDRDDTGTSTKLVRFPNCIVYQSRGWGTWLVPNGYFPKSVSFVKCPVLVSCVLKDFVQNAPLWIAWLLAPGIYYPTQPKPLTNQPPDLQQRKHLNCESLNQAVQTCSVDSIRTAGTLLSDPSNRPHKLTIWWNSFSSVTWSDHPTQLKPNIMEQPISSRFTTPSHLSS